MFIKLLNDGAFMVLENEQLYKGDRRINEEISNMYIQYLEQGKHYKIKNINGATFEEIFEEIVPIPIVEVPTLEARLTALEALMMGVI
ncbi:MULTISPECIES: hypothetical protein [unclassified Clostridium]|uniref:hypothetical protein n=1 Tax=unclassified Clostridium TaxID=2614128 RepID=UPI00321754CC